MAKTIQPEVHEITVTSWRITDVFRCPKCSKKVKYPDYTCEHCNVKVKPIMNFNL
jgi:DNA-directed RNA polymerase subunit RPC12/RpoP